MHISVLPSVISYKGHPILGGNGGVSCITLTVYSQFVDTVEFLVLLLISYTECVVDIIHELSITVVI